MSILSLKQKIKIVRLAKIDLVERLSNGGCLYTCFCLKAAVDKLHHFNVHFKSGEIVQQYHDFNTDENGNLPKWWSSGNKQEAFYQRMSALIAFEKHLQSKFEESALQKFKRSCVKQIQEFIMQLNFRLFSIRTGTNDTDKKT
jgi:hypothetical protein